MNRNSLIPFALVVLLTVVSASSLQAQPEFLTDENTGAMSQAPRVFIDAERLDMDYIRDEINFVNYVWDRQNADVHVLITQQQTGAGGTEYTLAFIGLKTYDNLHDTLTVSTDQTQTQDERRQQYTKTIKYGLLPYVASTPVFRELTLDIYRDLNGDRGGQEEVTDKWNYWVFELELSGNMNGEESQQSTRVNGGISAERVTENLKLDFRADYSYNESEFEIRDETVTSLRENWELSGEIIPSLSPHWSLGTSFEARSSTFSNIQLSYELMPGIEYNLFPYSEYARRELRLQYRLGYIHNSYVDTTIYNQISEGLGQTSLRAILNVTQPWGEATGTVEASTYLHDFERKRFEFFTMVRFRIIRGLSLNFNASYDIIHDQINLSAEELDPSEVLTRQRELATSYDYSVGVGISYVFGSIYNNIVNPRFGNGGGGGYGGGYGGGFGGRFGG